MLQAQQYTDDGGVIDVPGTLMVEGTTSWALARGTCHTGDLHVHCFILV